MPWFSRDAWMLVGKFSNRFKRSFLVLQLLCQSAVFIFSSVELVFHACILAFECVERLFWAFRISSRNRIKIELGIFGHSVKFRDGGVGGFLGCL